MGDAVLYGFDRLLRMVSSPAGCIRCAGTCCQLRDVKLTVNIAVRSGRPAFTGRCGRRILTAGHAVDIVIENNDGQLHVAACRMDQMIPSDRGAVSVAGDNDHVQLRIGQFDPGREGDRTAMCGMDRIEIQIACCPA